MANLLDTAIDKYNELIKYEIILKENEQLKKDNDLLKQKLLCIKNIVKLAESQV